MCPSGVLAPVTVPVVNSARGSGLSDGNRHTHEDLPVLMVGGGGGFRRGSHIQYPKDTPMTNLFLTLLDRIGVQAEKIGDSTGHIEHLTEV